MEVKGNIEVALEGLKDKYVKLLRVNILTNSFLPVVIGDDEWEIIKDKNFGIKEYWQWFASSEFLHEDSREKFKNFVKDFIKGKPCKYVVYKRKAEEGFHYMLMELIPCNNDEHILCVKDINDIYLSEFADALDKFGTEDAMTGLLNRVAFERDCASYLGGNVGIIFADLNALKYTNDNFGHEKGDSLIKEFAKLLKDYFRDYRVYRLSGDEFVVVSFNTNLGEFLRKSKSFYRFLQSMDIPMASFGYSVGNTLDGLMSEAENDMYIDKQSFYEKFPTYKRV